jgi:hypothetical protein
MGLHTYQLKCGCVEVTSTLEKEPKTFTLTYCKEHKPFEFQQVEEMKKDKEKKAIQKDES